MKLAILMGVVLLTGCADSRKKTADEFVAECKRAQAVLSMSYTIGGWGGESFTMTCIPKDSK